VRAGRTSLSAEARLQGITDEPLSPDGFRDAVDARSRLINRVVAVASSPLRRARETAQILAEPLGSSPAVLVDLRDVDTGRWTGRTVAEIAASEPKAFDAYLRFPTAATFPTGERMADAERRVFRVLESFAGDHPAGSVAMVTHELVIRLVLLRLRRLEGTAMWDPHIPPGSVTEVRATDEGFELPTILEGLFRASARERAGGRTVPPR